MSKPLVSIVCTVFKHESYLQECFDGFIMQKTDFPYEILVNDDCSPDGSAEIIREYETKYPHLFRCVYQKENQYSKGLHPWFEVLFPIAKGKYIAICEGDDYWTDPYKLQKQYDFMEANPDYIACFHNALIKYDANFSFFNSANENHFPSTEDIIKRRWFISTQTLFFRNIQLNYPSWKSKIVNEDYFLELLLAKEGKIYYMDDVMAVYRQDGKGLSAILNANKEKMYDQLIFLLSNIKGLYAGRYSKAFDDSIANYQSQKEDFIKSTHPIKKWFYKKTYTRALKKWTMKVLNLQVK